MRTFVGLDCGGTACRVLAVDEEGRAVFRGQSGPANLVATPAATLERSLRRATRGCPPADVVCGAFAGLVGPPQRERALRLLAEIFPGADLRAEPDYAAAHAAAPPGTHVTVVAGTGSLVCGLDAEGRLTKTGGGGYLLGDEGSGFRFGRAALAEHLKRPAESSEALRTLLEALFGTEDASGVVGVLYAAPTPQTTLARLLPAFAADLDADLRYAVAAADREIGDLAEVVALHASRHVAGVAGLRVSVTGGVWRASARFEGRFADALERATGRDVTVERLARPPVQGAVALARERG